MGRKSFSKRFMAIQKAERELKECFEALATSLDGDIKGLVAEARVGRQVGHSIRSRLWARSPEEKRYVLGLENLEIKEIEKPMKRG